MGPVDPVSWHFGEVQEVVAKGSALRVGRLFAGHYRIEGTLGEGGMGAVYRAHDLSLGRDVAIKVTQNPLNNAQRGRFRREGEVTAALDHAGIVGVHGGGVTEEGLPFLVLELVPDARNLKDVFAEVPAEERLRLLIEVARALGHAHARGVVHRDLKPSNVLVDVSGRARVCDFGLGWSEGQERLTRTGAFVGTPAYAPPEQWMTSGERSRPASDVWSLGVLLYEALTGVHPFAGATVIQTLALVREASPRPLRELLGDTARAAQQVAEKALSRDPEQRYSDASEFAVALEGAIERDSRPPGASSPLPGIGLIAVLCCLVAGAALAARSDTQPASTDSPSPTTSSSDVSPAGQGWVALEGQPPSAQLASARAWLEAHPSHPERAQVEVALAQLRLEVPLYELDHGTPGRSVRACYAGGLLWTYGQDVSAWDLETGELRAKVQVGAVGLNLLPTARGGVLAPLRGELAWIEGDRVVRRAKAALTSREVLLSSPEPGAVILTGPDGLRHFPPRTPYQLPDGLVIVAAATGPRLVALIGLDPRAPLEMGALILFDPITREASPRMILPSQTRVAAWSPDGEVLALGTLAGHVFLCDAEGKVRRKLTRELSTTEANPLLATLGERAHHRQVQGLAFSADGRSLHSISRGKRSRELDPNAWVSWDVATGRPVRVKTWERFSPTSVHTAPEGGTVALGGDDGLVQVWLER